MRELLNWGLAGVVVNKEIPKEILNRPLQFNTPFLINDYIR